MLSFSSGTTAEPSALLSNARSTIATLIQRPSAVTTSNAFDDFAILDNLIDVSNDVDRLDDGENRKFLNIAQLITASTCIYSRRVDALYKLINNFQSATSDGTDDSSSDDDQPADSSISLEPKHEKEPRKAAPSEIRAKPRSKNRSFICQDPSKISLNPTKSFFLDRTSLFDLKLFQTYVPVGNKQFWLHDHRPVIFDLLFDDQALRLEDEPPETERLIDALNRQSPRVQPLPTFDDADIPLPIPMDYDEHESSWQEASIDHRDRAVAKKTPSNHRKKKVQNQLDLNVFRQGLTDQQQALFHCQKTKPLSSKVKHEPGHFFVRTFNRKQFDALIKGFSASMVTVFIYPTITLHQFPIRERYSAKLNQSFSRAPRSPPMLLADVLNEDHFAPLSSSSPLPPVSHDDQHDDADLRLQTDMEQFLDAAVGHANEEQEHHQVFLTLRSSIQSYMSEHDAVQTIPVDDLVQSLPRDYSLPLVFSQLLHLCASTQRYSLHSTTHENLFIEKLA